MRSEIDDVVRLFQRLKKLDEGNNQRTPEEQEEVKEILYSLRAINLTNPELIDEYYNWPMTKLRNEP